MKFQVANIFKKLQKKAFFGDFDKKRTYRYNVYYIIENTLTAGLIK
jgi:hypothetical protein